MTYDGKGFGGRGPLSIDYISVILQLEAVFAEGRSYIQKTSLAVKSFKPPLQVYHIKLGFVSQHNRNQKCVSFGNKET